MAIFKIFAFSHPVFLKEEICNMKTISYDSCSEFPCLDTCQAVLSKSFVFYLPPFFGDCVLRGEKYE